MSAITESRATGEMRPGIVAFWARTNSVAVRIIVSPSSRTRSGRGPFAVPWGSERVSRYDAPFACDEWVHLSVRGTVTSAIARWYLRALGAGKASRVGCPAEPCLSVGVPGGPGRRRKW